MTQLVGGYPRRCPRSTADQPRKKQPRPSKYHDKTAHTAESQTVRCRKPRLSVEQVLDCPRLRAELCGVQLPKTDSQRTVLDSVEKRTADCPRVGLDCPAFKAVKHEVKKLVLDSVKNIVANYPQCRLGLSVGKNTKNA
jgi:hypothetical protein